MSKQTNDNEQPYTFMLGKHNGEWFSSWGGEDDDGLDVSLVEEFIALNSARLERLAQRVGGDVAAKDGPLLSVWWWQGKDYASVYPEVIGADEFKEDLPLQERDHRPRPQ
jgi:hypothetical protein